MLRNFLEPKLNERENPAVWFQQDGATVHMARGSLGEVRKMFPGRLISLRGDIPWPACLSDLAACDFFLWGHLKAEVCKRRPRTTRTESCYTTRNRGNTTGNDQTSNAELQSEASDVYRK
jgi:hypothetical protein